MYCKGSLAGTPHALHHTTHLHSSDSQLHRMCVFTHLEHSLFDKQHFQLSAVQNAQHAP